MFQRSRAGLRLGVLAGLAGLAGLSLAGCSAGSGSQPLASSSPSRPASPGPAVATPAPTPSPTQAATVISDCVRQQLGALSIPARAGQVLMIGVPARTATLGVRVIKQYKVGSIFLAGRSTSSVAAIRARTDALRVAAPATGPGLIVATDQEGGSVQVLGGSGFYEIPPALTQGAWTPAKLAERTRTWGTALAQAGITLDLAPVADTVTAARARNNPPIGEYQREYGKNSADVAAAVTTVIQSLNEVKVLSTVKHFPGLGRVRYNTDTSARAVDSIATADDVYLQPFAAGIKAGAGVVMISSARYPKLDPAAIAAFSKPIITGVLRGQLGYGGVVMSDDLGQAKAVSSVPVGQRAVRFIRAGGDLVLSVRSQDAAPMRAALIAEAKRSATFTTQLNQAVLRILQLKERAGLLPC